MQIDKFLNRFKEFQLNLTINTVIELSVNANFS